ncbi:MAG: hypothetical protein WEF99_07515 [Thermoanaerobaculia bacterium]
MVEGRDGAGGAGAVRAAGDRGAVVVTDERSTVRTETSFGKVLMAHLLDQGAGSLRLTNLLYAPPPERSIP